MDNKKILFYISKYWNSWKTKPLFWVVLIFSIWYVFFSLPNILFKDPYSLVLEDKNGELLGAKISKDGQWRFPVPDSIPEKFKLAILTFEDKRFFYHPGFDPIGIARAFKQNLSKKKVVSGGSTLSMQVIRMHFKNPRRNIFQKIKEIILATRLELRYSKTTILNLYSAHAPFGGNVVGLEAASWRYFGKKPSLLSWAESAMLAVLPNSPSLVTVSKNRDRLLLKRNRLLNSLLKSQHIDSLTYLSSIQEPLPEKPNPIPSKNSHLLDFAEKQKKGSKFLTSIDPDIQDHIERVAKNHQTYLSSNGINNLGIMVQEIETGNVVGYLGNMPGTGFENSESVDVIHARRSSGSTLKPLLYALALEEGVITPQSLIQDIPTRYAGYEPENFLETFDGVIPASKAVSRSLNVPLVRMQLNYGTDKFLTRLRKMGFTTLPFSSNHYGLSLILGGAEISLWELVGVYSSLARTVQHFSNKDSRYYESDFRKPNVFISKEKKIKEEKKLINSPVISAGPAWLGLEAMKELERPTQFGRWESFMSKTNIAWKTGTSFGFRDAWAVGVTPKYAVGVWVGNADGEGRAGLIGYQVAAPIFFDVFRNLRSNEWFVPPYDDLKKTEICKNSGYSPVPNLCPVDTILGTKKNTFLNVCPYHQLIQLDENNHRIDANCPTTKIVQEKSWFVLPALEEFFYKTNHPEYTPLPPFRNDCNDKVSSRPMIQLVYPRDFTKMIIPKELDGKKGKVVFRAIHVQSNEKIYWYLDNEYLKFTELIHQLELSPSIGVHRLTLTDKKGNRLEQKFEVVE
jgi:penicillin-binding protein 1C